MKKELIKLRRTKPSESNLLSENDTMQKDVDLAMKWIQQIIDYTSETKRYERRCNSMLYFLLVLVQAFFQNCFDGNAAFRDRATTVFVDIQ
jgi:hypothetical protein